MASANGILSPQSQPNLPGTSPPSGKRKRAESNEPGDQANGAVESKATAQLLETSPKSQQQIADFVEVLKSYDTSPSILKQPLPARETSTEPQPKRKKAEDERDASTIITRAASALYTTLEDVLSDAKSASSAILEQLHLPNRESRTQNTPISPQKLILASKVKAFKSMAENIVEAEKAHQRRRSHMRQVKEEDTRSLANGSLPTSNVAHLTADPADNKVVLTLYGNAGGPKQLFSSLQQPVRDADGDDDVALPLREAGLPHGIGTTQIVPLATSGLVEDKKRALTMGELFTNPPHTLALQPPKPSSIASTRSSIVGWYQPSGLDSMRARGDENYFGENLTCGQWLSYKIASRPTDVKLPERAMSLVGAKLPPTASSEPEAVKTDELFRSIYSSFAPVKDDTAAIVSEGQTNRIWWQRVGEKSLERLVNTSSFIKAIQKPQADAEDDPDVLRDEISKEMEEFQEAVKDWDPQCLDPALEESEQIPTSIQDKEVEEVLQEISDLLETLNSYQRIRNLSLTPLPRSGGTSTASDPAKPSEGELATYHTLKAQLTLMIAMLPPYAVAKLNSDRLAELNISTKIQLTTENFKGVMEEDEVATRAKVAEMRAASTSRATPVAALSRTTSSQFGNAYPSRSSISGTPQYYAPSQTPTRPPPISLNRSPATVPTPYPGQRQSSSVSFRPQTGFSTPTYPHQLPRGSQTPYGATNSPQYFQNQAASGYSQAAGHTYSSGPLSTPLSNLNARFQTSNQTSYQQNRVQSLTNGLDYRYSNGNTARQTSPQKPQVYSPQSQSAQVQSRSFGTSISSLNQDHRYIQPPSTNGASSLSPQPQSSQQPQHAGVLGATGYHTVMTPEQQSTMMERQRAQLAQNLSTQAHTRNAPQTSGQQANGGNAVTAGL